MFNYNETNFPAFPTNEGDTFDGMTLRDYFASKAMHAHYTAQYSVFYANPKSEDDVSPFELANEVDVAEQAYEMADAMLEARKN